MAKSHKVQQGENISKIAQAYGFPSWQSLYNHSDNQTLKKSRPNPDIIYPGDEIVIPLLVGARFDAKMNQKHVFRSKVTKNMVKLKVGAIGGKIWTDRNVELEVDDKIIESKTDADGIAEFKLPKNHSYKGILRIYTPKETTKPSYSIEVKLGHLDPITELTGQQARLTALGFDCGLLTKLTNKRYENSVSNFQAEFGLEVDGICGPNTQKKLENEYGC